MKKWVDSTPIHGPQQIFADDSSSITRITWMLFTLAALIGAVSLSWNQFVRYFDGHVRTEVIPLDNLEPMRITYCSDDWIDLAKVSTSGIGVHTFAYFLTLLPGMYNKYDVDAFEASFYNQDLHFRNGVNLFYDNVGVLVDKRIRQDRAYAKYFLVDKDQHEDDLELTSTYTVDVEGLAANVAQFARAHQLNDLLSFALYFARENVTMRDTKEIGHSIQFGRLCRELEHGNDNNSSSSLYYTLKKGMSNFFVKYDFTYGITSISKSTFDVEAANQYYSRRVGILPYIGGKSAPQYVTQQRMLETSNEDQYQFVHALPEITKDNYWTLVSNSKPTFLGQITNIFSTRVVNLKFSQELEIRRKPNSGQSLCEHQGDGVQVPPEYTMWECMDECQEEASAAVLECEFVGSSTNLSELTNPCSCLKHDIKYGAVFLPDFGTCGIIQAECIETCQNRLPFCRSYTAKMKGISPVRFVSREHHQLKFPGEFPEVQNNTLLHIQIDVTSASMITEYIDVTGADLVVGLGGTTGFFMGISVIALVHLITSICQSMAAVVGRVAVKQSKVEESDIGGMVPLG